VIIRQFLSVLVLVGMLIPLTGCGGPKVSGQATEQGSDAPPQLTPEQIQGEKEISKRNQ
jgi:hypothetical protein